jgi:hypothetical protein
VSCSRSSSTWEIDYGLDSRATAGDDGASGDPDRDGVTNLEENARDSSPRARYVQYFAEMSTGDRQKLWSYVSAYQPEHKRGSTQVRLFGDGGRSATFVSDHIFAGGSLSGIRVPGRSGRAGGGRGACPQGEASRATRASMGWV